MSEYLEAISRLNAPERNPGISISRSLFPIPRRDTPINMNRIMAETLNSPLPKYSIPQVFNIVNGDGETSYTFPLDKQFTLAKGGRKSIGIRCINFGDGIGDLKEFLAELQAHFKITFEVFIEYITIDNQDNYFFNNTAELDLNNIDWSKLKSTGDPITDEKTVLKIDETTSEDYLPIKFLNLMMRSKIDSILAGKDEFRDLYSITEKDGYSEISIKLPNDYIVVYNPQNHIHVKLEILHLGHTVKDDEDHSHFENDGDNNMGFLINTNYIISNSIQKDLHYITNKFPEFKAVTLPIMTCSSLNPWSPRNIIGSTTQYHDVINRVFPYDNQQEIRVWFIDQLGRILPNTNKTFDGYLELELIIDNENNFAIDQN